MKKSHATLTRWLAASVLLLASPALATSDKDCDRPRPPTIPDGKTATDVEMIGATQRTKLYRESAQTFLDCLEEARNTLSETARDVKLKRIDKKREEVEKERDETIAKFNEQVRAYKLRTGEASQESPPEPAPAPPTASSDAPAPGSKPR